MDVLQYYSYTPRVLWSDPSTELSVCPVRSMSDGLKEFTEPTLVNQGTSSNNFLTCIESWYS